MNSTLSDPSESSDDDLILLGHITRTQGHRGEVRLLPVFDPPSRFDELRGTEIILFMPQSSTLSRAPRQRRVLNVEEFWYHQRFIIISFAEIPDMTAAEKICGAEAYVRPDTLWELDPDEFYPHEVEGFQLVDQSSGTILGTITGVQFGAAHDYLKVQKDKGSFIVPLVKEVVHRVDKAESKVFATLPPGLDEL